ncbi:anaerobic dehydrogenase, typically selenocysteine-containing [Candidatus Methanoperedens nitroreducens]|uniref:Anaerobic dehydrogenase, typically selenocysteine-containing n=1 Tax=Candidatus Methanoperedens nitratireducens TaxID=1392998 RepID=A0A062VCB9_9EURY|nr:molybdopterin-dependent oxidoreductase [Candidatus Methanoperedens nitroreducens]KCZ73339.1 anaerobic dehydrogenase, typically selenocysteine-containing [Candidatus Methanoperedens nitroreducens]MDJ1422713.1 molybdopterin-dependent oxidoreductase [Candidatus Methanoperedens sp.]
MAFELKMNRRGFLKVAGIAGAASLGYLSLDQPVIKALAQGTYAASEEKWVATGCVGCVGWCPLQVRVANGRAVKIRGNQNSVWTRGKVCPRAHLNLQMLYDPDRIKTPLKRTNPNKGRDQDPGWEAITWEEALSTITLKLRELRDKGTPERFVSLRGRYDSASADLLYSRFTKAYGTPNSVSHSAICAESTKAGRWMSMGDYDYSGYDWYNANYIISFGAPLLEAHRPVTGNIVAFGEVRRGGKARANFVMVDPRYSVTASKADEWIPVNPGTDAAFALGMAHVILTEGLWDRSFVGDFNENSPVKGFETGKAISEDYTTEAGEKEETFKEASTYGLIKWWNVYLKDFTPEIAAQKTTVPAETIKRLAREFAKAKPSIAASGRGSDAWPGSGSFNSYAVMSLNALSGSIEKVVNHRPSVKYSEEAVKLEQDEVAEEGTKKQKIDESKTKKFPFASVVTNNVADNILRDYPYPVEVILAWWSNFAHSTPGSKRWEDVFKKVPFVVHHTTHISDTSIYADILLPAKTYIEKWGYGHPAGTAGLSRGTTLFQPAVAPLYDCKSELELGLELGKRLGEYYPSINKSFEGIGGNYGDTAEGYVRARTEEQWNAFPGGWDEFRQKGATNHSYKPKTEFSTPSKKFEFYSSTLKATFEKLNMTDEDLDKIQIKARGDVVYVPHFENPIFIGDKGTYPLSLITYKPMLNQEGRSHNSQWAQEIYLPLYDTGWTNLAEINPETAEKFGIKDGDTIYVESEVGKIRARAKVFHGIHPEVVSMAYGQGHFSYGKFAKNRGANPNAITGVMYDHITGMAAFFNTRVKIEKA